MTFHNLYCDTMYVLDISLFKHLAIEKSVFRVQTLKCSAQIGLAFSTSNDTKISHNSFGNPLIHGHLDYF